MKEKSIAMYSYWSRRLNNAKYYTRHIDIESGYCTYHLVSAVPHGAALAADDGGRGEPLLGLRGEVQRECEHQVIGGVHRAEPDPDPTLVIIIHGPQGQPMLLHHGSDIILYGQGIILHG